VPPARKADKLTPICEPTVYKMSGHRHLIALLAFKACYSDRFTFFYLYLMVIMSQIDNKYRKSRIRP
jgi:hypothetical protein